MDSQIHESSKPLFRRISLIAGVWLVLIAAAVTGYLLKDKYIALWNMVFSGADTEEQEMATLANDIYFTLLDTQSTSGELTTYSISDYTDPSSVLSKRIDIGDATQLSFSPNGEWVTFIGKTRNSEEAMDDSDLYQVFRASLNDSTLEEAVANAEQVTDIQAAKKSIPSINNQGEILFVSRGIGTDSTEAEVSPVPGDWTIHYIRIDNIQTAVANGMYPQWYDDGNFFYLSDNGIIHHVVEGAHENRLISLFVAPPEDGVEETDSDEAWKILPHYIDTIFDISNDGTFLIVPTSIEGKIGVFNIVKTDEDISLELVTTKENLHAFWPQISPDNQHVGFLQFNPLRYGVYDLVTLESVSEAIGLESFDSEEIFITDWR